MVTTSVLEVLPVFQELNVKRLNASGETDGGTTTVTCDPVGLSCKMQGVVQAAPSTVKGNPEGTLST